MHRISIEVKKLFCRRISVHLLITDIVFDIQRKKEAKMLLVGPVEPDGILIGG